MLRINNMAPSVFLTLANLRQRRGELLNVPSEPPQPEPDPTPGQDPPPQPLLPPHQLSANPVLGEAALYGVAGSAARALAPHTEAHPAAILLQLLVAFGSAAGPGPHCLVDATRHGLNLFVVLVGESSKARKGTSWNQVRRLFSEVDRPWVTERVTSARLTPAALLHDLRDQQPATDRRLLALSEEFAAVLNDLGRAKGSLSPLLRCAWDSGDLSALDGRRPVQATGTHISLIAHITQRELAQHLHPTEAHNGFANRCLWTAVQRSQCLPEGGNLGADELSAIAAELRRALDWAHNQGSVRLIRDVQARDFWHECYPALSQVRPGLYGAATSRAEAQVLRLSAIYAVLDCSSTITLPHLQAALAVWDYCAAGSSVLFGTSTGDHNADRIREAINASSDGLSRKQISALFHGHLSSDRIEAALEQLVSLDAIHQSTRPSGGRPSNLWSATPGPESMDEQELEDESRTGETTTEDSIQDPE
jgi:hypothetical protein